MNWDRIEGNWSQLAGKLKRRLWLQRGGLALCIALGVWTGVADAGFLSSTGPVIAILAP